MAENYSHLVQAVATTSPRTIYDAKPKNITILKDIIICNQDSDARKFSLCIVKVNPETDMLDIISEKTYLFYNANIDPNETVSLTITWCLDPGSELMFSADKDNCVSVNGFGITVLEDA